MAIRRSPKDLEADFDDDYELEDGPQASTSRTSRIQLDEDFQESEDLQSSYDSSDNNAFDAEEILRSKMRENQAMDKNQSLRENRSPIQTRTQRPVAPERSTQADFSKQASNERSKYALSEFLDETTESDEEDEVEEEDIVQEDDAGFLDAEDPDSLLPSVTSKATSSTATQEAEEKPDIQKLFGSFDFGRDSGDSSVEPRIGLNRNSRLGQQQIRQQAQENEQRAEKVEKPPREKQKAEESDDSNDVSLQQWSEQFSYQPAVEYVRLRRLYPKMWEGIQLAGWIEDLYEPVDEQDIGGRWGGGTYQFEAIQLDKSGRPRNVGRKILTISGIPTHYSDEKGNAYPLPMNNKQGGYQEQYSRRDEMVLHRSRGVNKFGGGNYQSRGDEPSYGYRDEPSRSQNNTQNPQSVNPASVISSAAELFRMTQANSEAKKEDHKALEILRSAQNDVQAQMAETSKQQQEIYKEMLKRQAEELERMRKEQEALMEKAQKPLSEALNVVSNRAENEVTVLRQQIQKLELEARDRLAAVKDEQARLFMVHQKEKDDLRDIYTKQIEIIKEDHNKHYLAHQKEKEELRLAVADQIDLLREEHSKAYNALLKEKDDIRTSFIKQIEDQRNEQQKLFQNFQKEKEDLKSAHLVQLDTVRQEYRQRETDLKTQVQTSSTENFQAVKLQMDTLRDSHQVQISNMQKENQSTVNQLYAEIAKLREDARERESKAREEAFKRESELRMSHMKEVSDLKNEGTERLNQVRLDAEKREREIKDNFNKSEKELKEAANKNEKELKEAANKNEKELKESFAKIEKELKSTYETREKDLRDRLDERERAHKESLENKYVITIESLREKLEVLKSSSDEKVKDYMKDTERREKQMQSTIESNFRAQIAIIEADRDRLKNELESIKRELDLARKERKELTDPVAKLKEIKNFKSQLQEYGFVTEEQSSTDKALALIPPAYNRRDDDDEDDDDEDDRKKKKEEAPKGILGQIAHYGPAIASNILAPVLQRVDSATKVANDALEAQKQELNNQAKLLELQAKEMEQNKARLEQENNALKVQQNQILQAQAIKTAQDRAAAIERQKRSLQGRALDQNILGNNPNAARQPRTTMTGNPRFQNPVPMMQQNMGQFQRPQNPVQSTSINLDPRQNMRGNQNPRFASQSLIPTRAEEPVPARSIRQGTVIPTSFDEGLSAPNQRTQLTKPPASSQEFEFDIDETFDASQQQEQAPQSQIQMPSEFLKPRPIQRRSGSATPTRTPRVLGLGKGLEALEPSAKINNVNENQKKGEKDLTTLSPSTITDQSLNPQIDANKTEREETMPVSEGYIKLAEFLNDQMKDDVSAEDAANKLKTGVMLGLVPKDVFNEAISNSFEGLYDNVKAAAELKNFPKIISPKGLSYCQKLYTKLKA